MGAKSRSSTSRKQDGKQGSSFWKDLPAEDDLYRIRKGDYGIIYTIRDKELVVLVVKTGDRAHFPVRREPARSSPPLTSCLSRGVSPRSHGACELAEDITVCLS